MSRRSPFELDCGRRLYLSCQTEIREVNEMVSTINREELKAKIDRRDRFTLVETLPTEAYHHGHLPGAINLPPDRITELAASLFPNKSAEIVVYCAKPS